MTIDNRFMTIDNRCMTDVITIDKSERDFVNKKPRTAKC